MGAIHPSAVVDPEASLAEGVEIGAFAVVGPFVELDHGVKIASHAVVEGRTRVGADTRISSFACLGGAPQVKDLEGEPARLEIGARNVIREHVTIHAATPGAEGCTRIGDDNYIMNAAHIAHDCRVGSNCIISSYCGLAGHVQIEDHAVLGAYTGVHQHGRVGESVMAASNSKLSLDAPPFAMVAGDRARLVGVNSLGLRRRLFPPPVRKSIKRAFHIVFHSNLLLEAALERAREELGDNPEVERLLCFLETSERGFCR